MLENIIYKNNLSVLYLGKPCQTVQKLKQHISDCKKAPNRLEEGGKKKAKEDKNKSASITGKAKI